MDTAGGHHRHTVRLPASGSTLSREMPWHASSQAGLPGLTRGEHKTVLPSNVNFSCNPIRTNRKEVGMIRKTLTHALMGLRALSVGMLVVGLLVSFGPNIAHADADDAENTLLIWAGDQAHQAPDFIAVVNFD